MGEAITVVSVTTKKNLQYFKYMLNAFVDRSEVVNIIVCVPSADYDAFLSFATKLNSPKLILKTDEDFAPELLTACESNTISKDRRGWYLQQLLKLKLASKAVSDNVLIWDADTVLLDLEYEFLENGKCKFILSNEYNSEYFQFNKRILDLKRLANGSFISQHIVFKRFWLEQLLAEIEERHSGEWYDIIVSLISPNHGTGFSEYELLGNYFVKNFSKQMEYDRVRWLRRGELVRRLIFLPRGASIFVFSKIYTFVAFEPYDTVSNSLKRLMFRLIYG